MNKRKPRIVTVGTTPTPLRDTTKPAAAGAIYYYASGVVRLGSSLDMTMTVRSKTFKADNDFFDPGQDQTYGLVAAGTVDVEVWELEA